MRTRKATMRDIPALLELINGYAAGGIMLPRTEFDIAENIRDFSVVEDDEPARRFPAEMSDNATPREVSARNILACGALHFYTPTIGEVRSVAVASGTERKGIGRTLVLALEEEAKSCNLDTVFAFTYVPGFFGKLGFLEVDRSELPLKVWKDCMRCPKYIGQCCDELAMVKYLDGREHHRQPVADPGDPELESIELPVVRRQGRS